VRALAKANEATAPFSVCACCMLSSFELCILMMALVLVVPANTKVLPQRNLTLHQRDLMFSISFRDFSQAW